MSHTAENDAPRNVDALRAARELLADGRCLCSSAATDWDALIDLLNSVIPPIEKPTCNWPRCNSPRLGKCFAWCKCRCHNRVIPPVVTDESA
jgi:hypothetical protein